VRANLQREDVMRNRLIVLMIFCKSNQAPGLLLIARIAAGEIPRNQVFFAFLPGGVGKTN